MQRRIPQLVGLLLVAALAIAGYLVASARTYGLGFPLDDAWIHQTYARNLAERGEWAFLPGEPSSGSTSPLWSFVLAIGRWIGMEPRAWAYAVGLVLLILTAWESSRWLQRRQPGLQGWILAAAALVALEWHLVWASVSGMETLALAFVILQVLSRLDRGEWPVISVGIWLGIGLWLRPDALLLAIPVGIAGICHTQAPIQDRLRRVLLTYLVAAPLAAAYLSFNHALSGEWWPMTFFAKQAEYAVYRGRPLLLRLAEQVEAPLIGIGILLVPGALLGLARDVRARAWVRLAALSWVWLHWAAYAIRLPVTYQHGRYAIPVIPTLLVLGLDGLFGWVKPLDKSVVRRVVSRVWLLSLPVVGLVFYGLGAVAYGRDVAMIETEMVAASRWISQYTESDALIAAHDIGALGYFGERALLDLAGLVSPEVIPILRDEAALQRYLDERGANYLMTFPDWYPRLVERGRMVYTTGGEFMRAAGRDNMAVYRWEPTSFARPAPAVLYSFQSYAGRDAHGNHRGRYRR